jgi:hypothetical protein
MSATTSDDDRVLGYGEDAVERPQVVLDDEFLAPPPGVPHGKKKQPSKKHRKKGKLVVIVAGGFEGDKGNDAEEVRRHEAESWSPNTKDFMRTARDTLGVDKPIRSASNAKQFFGALADVEGNISRIVYIGHGGSGGLVLSGDTFGFPDETLEKGDFGGFQNLIDAKIRPKLLDGAVLDLVACSVAVDLDFMKDMATSLGVVVRGFDDEIAWCLKPEGVKKGEGSPDYSQAEIRSRGRIARLGDVKEWEANNPKKEKPDCTNSKVWHKGVGNLEKLRPRKVEP